MENEKNNGRGIFYGVIGVATLVVAIIGATFAYFTATASSNDGDITGNMASTNNFTLEVEKATKIDETAGGMIPMSNGMVEAAVNLQLEETQKLTNGGDRAICQDQNGNAVCQIYKITVDNSAGTIGGLFDGYVALTGGSGESTDLPISYQFKNNEDGTTMRWAQVFCSDKSAPQEGDSVENCSTGGKSGFTLDSDGEVEKDFPAIGKNKSDGKNSNDIHTDNVTESGTIKGQDVNIINQNYIRISDHTAGNEFNRTDDITSALVFDQNIAAQGEKTFYIVVWLSENNKDQSVGSNESKVASSANNFFEGTVSFYSADGGKISSVFSGYTSATEG